MNNSRSYSSERSIKFKLNTVLFVSWSYNSGISPVNSSESSDAAGIMEDRRGSWLMKSWLREWVLADRQHLISNSALNLMWFKRKWLNSALHRPQLRKSMLRTKSQVRKTSWLKDWINSTHMEKNSNKNPSNNKIPHEVRGYSNTSTHQVVKVMSGSHRCWPHSSRELLAAQKCRWTLTLHPLLSRSLLIPIITWLTKGDCLVWILMRIPRRIKTFKMGTHYPLSLKASYKLILSMSAPLRIHLPMVDLSDSQLREVICDCKLKWKPLIISKKMTLKRINLSIMIIQNQQPHKLFIKKSNS